jgi:hypothetical protein
MGGKAALLLVLGFGLIFLVVTQNFGSISTHAVDNMVDYTNETVAHDIAVSGANMAANAIFLDNSWTTGYNNIDFNDGKLNVSVQVINAFKNIRKITSLGSFGGITRQVEVILSPSKFSKFAYYSVSEGSNIWWTNKDTVWGPFHTQDYLRAYRHPVFYGKTTTKKKVIYYTNKGKDEPQFYGGFEQGIDLPLPTNGLSPIEIEADNGGYKFVNKDTVYLTFATDSIKYKFNYTDPYTTVLASSFTSNGVIYAKDAILRIKGTVKGQYTVAASGSGSKGTIYIDDDIVYSKDPRMYPNSSDLLGIVSKNNILITDNAANHDDINIHASIYSESGGFGAENYSSRPPSGDINLLGGIIQNTRQAVGTFNSGGIQSGFNKRYKYDERLLIASPPAFPGTGSYEIVSWLE